MKSVLQYRASPLFKQQLMALAPAWLDLAIVDGSDIAQLRLQLVDAEVLLHVLEPVDSSLIDSAPRLKLIQKIGVGVDTIDLKAAARRGVKVANMPGTNSRAVAEMTLGLMLTVLRQITALDRATRSGAGWSLPENAFDRCREVGGKTVGLIGYGAVPQLLTPVLQALGARIICFTRTSAPAGVAEWCSLDKLLSESDIISLHVPLTPTTRGMLGGAQISQMKRGAIIINTARGALIDENALVSGLLSGSLGGAGLDVFANEPLSPDSPLLKADNVVVTPHVAWLTPETLSRSLGMAISNCERLRDGLQLLNEIRLS